MAKYRGPTDDMGVVIMTMFPMTTSSMHTTICTLRTFVLAACQVTNTLARNAANHGGAVSNSVCVLLYPSDPTIVGNCNNHQSASPLPPLPESLTKYVNACDSKLQCCITTNKYAL